MSPADILRLIVPAGLAFLVAYVLDWQSARKGLLPPGFAVPWRRALAARSSFFQRKQRDPAGARAWLAALPNVDGELINKILRDNAD